MVISKMFGAGLHILEVGFAAMARPHITAVVFRQPVPHMCSWMQRPPQCLRRCECSANQWRRQRQWAGLNVRKVRDQHLREGHLRCCFWLGIPRGFCKGGMRFGRALCGARSSFEELLA